MKATVLFLSFALVVTYTNASTMYEDALSDIENLYAVEGKAVGEHLKKSKFFKLSTRLKKHLTEDEKQMLLKEESPIAKCMGLLLLAYDLEKNESSIQALFGDQQQVELYKGGCLGEDEYTVGDFARDIYEDSFTRSCFLKGVKMK